MRRFLEMIAPKTDFPVDFLPPELLKKYDRPVPRYTSYPTAPHFKEEYRPEDKAHDLAQAAQSEGPVSAYIHLPFCSSVCLFCGCNVTPTRDHSRGDRYLDFLIREIDLTLEHYPASRPVDQLHFGGGTPTFFTPAQLARLLTEFGNRFDFTADPEISIECNPRDTTSEHLRVLKEMGVNRLSFGIQDLNRKTQEAVNRIESEAVIRALVEEARELGFESISFDLIYGLPHQTTASFARTLKRIARLRPDRLALFSFAYLPERIPRQKGIDADALPSPRVKNNIFRNAMHFLIEEGYRHIGLDHFALPEDPLNIAREQGYLNRNFQGYHARPHMDLLSFGVSSIGNLGPTYQQNFKAIPIWEAFIEKNRLPVERGIRLTNDDLYRRRLIHDVLCRERVDLPGIAGEFSRDPDRMVEEARAAVAGYVADGLASWDCDTLVLEPRGRLLARVVASAFDTTLNRNAQGTTFSRAV